MARGTPRLLAVLAVAILGACSSSSSPQVGGLPATGLTVTATPATVEANGASTVSVAVSGPAQGTVVVLAGRGTFSSGSNRAEVAALPATLTLTSCDAAASQSCAGRFMVRAGDAIGTYGEVAVTFTAPGGGVTPTCTTCGATACVGSVCDTLGHVCSSATPSTCSECPGGTAEVCGDGIDNNCDGLVDCDDPKCQPVGNNLGQQCDALGHTCSVKGVTGRSTCTTCSGNGGTAEARETSCGDNFDNDCDGLVDCQDPDCAGLTCNAAGLTCSATALTCSVCPGGEQVEATCGDGKDNDCNGFTDCKDPACQPTASAPGRSCGPHGQVCTAAGGGTCACLGNGGTPETVEASCGDGKDNDCNGLVDCADGACDRKSCDAGGSVGKVCTSGICTCSTGTVEICDDGIDNNCDGRVDCGDPTCQPSGSSPGGACGPNGMRCSAATATAPGTCSVCSGNGGTPQAAETSCNDGFDNDCDGLVDCADPDCLGGACSPVNSRYTCVNVAGTVSCADPTLPYTLTLAAGSSRIPANGVATTTVTATLTQNGVPMEGRTVAFATSLAGTTLSAAAPTDAAGRTAVTLTANTLGGTAVVTATYAVNGTSSVSGTATVVLPRLGQVRFVSSQYEILGVRSSQYQETGLLTFEVLDTSDTPYPPGLEVVLTHQSLGRSYIGASGGANCTAAAPSVCTVTAVTGADGRVQVPITSGYVAGVVSVSAGATAGGLSASGAVTNLAIVGAKASGAHISVECYAGAATGKRAPIFPALAYSDCNYSYLPDSATCRVALADRFNNALGVSTLTQFFSEAGTAGPASFTPQYDVARPPSGQLDLGVATSYVRTDGKIPKDVDRFPGEDFVPYHGPCPIVQANPRDGLVTVIVMANGEEGFVDRNGNGEYDAGEPFIDIGEPYIDENDNGAYDVGEFFVDLNGDQAWNGPNGTWDRNTVLWTENRILYTGEYKYASFAATSFDLTVGGWSDYRVSFLDPYLNPPAGVGMGGSPAAFTAGSTTGSATAAVTVTPAPLTPVNLSDVISFTQSYCDPTRTTCGNVCPSAPCHVVTNVGACNADRTSCTGFAYDQVGTVRVTGAVLGADTVWITATRDGRSLTATLPGVVR